MRASAARSAGPGRCRRPDRMPPEHRHALPRDRCGRLHRRVDDEAAARGRASTPSARTSRPTAAGCGSSPAIERLRTRRSSRSTSPIAMRSGLLVETERITHVIHLAALQAPFCRADPVRGSQVNVTGHDQRLRGGARRARARSLGRLRELRGGLRAGGHVPGRLVRDDSPLLPVLDDLRRLQAGQRVVREGVRSDERPADGRAAAVHRLRPGPRPGHDVGTVGRDPVGRRRRPVPHPVRRLQPVPLRRGRGARLHRRQPGRGDRGPGTQHRRPPGDGRRVRRRAGRGRARGPVADHRRDRRAALPIEGRRQRPAAADGWIGAPDARGRDRALGRDLPRRARAWRDRAAPKRRRDDDDRSRPSPGRPARACSSARADGLYDVAPGSTPAVPAERRRRRATSATCSGAVRKLVRLPSVRCRPGSTAARRSPRPRRTSRSCRPSHIRARSCASG